MHRALKLLGERVQVSHSGVAVVSTRFDFLTLISKCTRVIRPRVIAAAKKEISKEKSSLGHEF